MLRYACVSNNCMHTAQAAQYDSVTLINIINHQGHKLTPDPVCMPWECMNQIILV